MTTLKLFLLGPPRIEHNGTPVNIERRKALAILIYLAVSGRPHSRDALATLFWPDQSQSQARAYLRRDLAVLNTSLARNWLLADRETVELQQESDFWLDVGEFRRLLAESQQHHPASKAFCADCLARLSQAADLYGDDFLAGFSLRDSAEFDDWQFFQAESLRQELAQLLERLVEGYSAAGAPEMTIPYARRWVALDPLHEPAQRQLIALYDQAGQLAAALHQYEEYVKLLEAELGLPPEEDTSTLYEAIKAKRMLASYFKAEQQPKRVPEREPEPRLTAKDGVEASAGPQPKGSIPYASDAPIGSVTEPKQAGADETGEITPVSPPPAAVVAYHHLPVQPTPFIGREAEKAEIVKLLINEPACRLLTLIGPGGIGKTRLALAAAAQAGEAFYHSVYFVPLAPLNSAENIVSTLADAINFNFYEGQEPKQQLLDYLRRRQTLLILDNFEHILDGASLVWDILQAAPEVKFLVTSREQLNLSGETVYSLSGLNVPLQDTAEAALDVDAVRLLIQQARLVRSDFEPTAEDVAAMVRIGRLTQGMPLALILAAGWLEVLSFAEIAAEIAHNLDILETEIHDVPDRQRSVRAAFDYSWQRLTPPEQQIFMKLSIFRGGFNRQAAQAVAGAELRSLRGLVKKSLISLNQENRYEIHELLRQYAAEKLAASPDLAPTQALYSLYYLNFLDSCQSDIIGARQLEVLNQIELDLENIRAAWNWAVEQRRLDAIKQGLDTLYHFYAIRSLFQEGKTIFETAAKRLQTASLASEPSLEMILGQLVARTGAFCYSLSLNQQADELLRKSLELARRFDNQKELAFSLNFLGELARVQGDHISATTFFQESLTFGRGIGDRLSIAHSLKGLGWVNGEEGSNYLEASRYYKEALVFYRDLENRAEIAFCLDKLAYSAWQLGNYDEGESLAQESLAIFREIGDLLGMAKALGALALVNLSLGGERLIKAKSFALEALAACQETGHQMEMVNRMMILSMSLLRLGEVDQADFHYQEGLLFSQRIDYKVGAILCLNGLGETAYRRGDLPAARQYLVEAAKNALITPRVQDIAQILGNFAELLLLEARDTAATPPTQAGDRSLTGNKGKAAEILFQVLSEPASWQITTDKSKRLLAELAAELGPEAISSLRDASKNRTLEELLAEEMGL